MISQLNPTDYLSVICQVLCVIFLLTVIKNVLRWKSLKKQVNKMPGPQETFPIGNVPIEVLLYNTYSGCSPTTFLSSFLMGIARMYPKDKVIRFWIGVRPYVYFSNADAVEALLSSSSELTKTFEYNFLHPWLGTGLLTSTGNKWRSRRKMLTPSFHFRILDHFQEVFNEQSIVFVQKIKELSKENKPLSLEPLVTAFTLDVICETAMGTKLGAQNVLNSEYVDAIRRVGEIIMQRVLRPIMWPKPIFTLTSAGRDFYRSVKILHDFTDKVITERKTKKLFVEDVDSDLGVKRRLVFMDILLKEQEKSGLTDEDIREEVDTFMFEGHDTTAMGICWALFLLGNHQDVQRKVQEELDAIFSSDLDKSITPAELKEMKYLDCVLKECQRLYPSVPIIGRELKQDMKVGEHVVPIGVSCVVSPPALHMDPDVFPDPEVFDLDRFLPENCNGRHPYAYVPFSAGPRNCIGQKFALLEEKTVIAQCLRQFNIQSVDKPDKIPVKPELVTRPCIPLLVSFKERNQKILTRA